MDHLEKLTAHLLQKLMKIKEDDLDNGHSGNAHSTGCVFPQSSEGVVQTVSAVPTDDDDDDDDDDALDSVQATAWSGICMVHSLVPVDIYRKMPFVPSLILCKSRRELYPLFLVIVVVVFVSETQNGQMICKQE